MLRRDVMPDFYSKGMASTVRAVALAALAGHGNINRSDLQRYQHHLPQMSLFGKAHFLLAALAIKDSESIRGDLVRADIFVSLPTARNFVVVDDPVPGGLEPLNRDLATASTVDADKGDFKHGGGSWWFRYSDWSSYGVSRWSFYHQELRHNAARFYSEYLPAGNYHLSYTAQAIAPGEFVVMPIYAEEMYDPDVFGKGVVAELKVSR